MAPIARRYATVLFTVLARPWTWLMLGVGLMYAVPFAVCWVRGDFSREDVTMLAVAVVDGPPLVAASFEELAASGGLESQTDWDTRWGEGGSMVGAQGRGMRDSAGDWPNLDRFPALERLWMAPPDVLSEGGWRRIGEHRSLELLSLVNVASPDADALARYPSFAHAALTNLTKLRQLDLRGTGGSFDLLLPRLPALETCAIGWGKLDENLATLADGSPRLHTLGIETWSGHVFTQASIDALARMPSLRTLSIAAASRASDEPAQRRQIAFLARALPGVRVVPGTYCPWRIWTVLVTSLLAMFLPFVFWFQTCVLLSTAPNWMLPRRLGPHLFWPMAASAVCGGVLVGVARSAGVAWLPGIVLALFATGLGAYGALSRDLAGLPARVTGALLRIDVAACFILAGLALFGRPPLDRWLTGSYPLLDGVLLAAAAAGLVWKLDRLARIPRILAEQGGAAVPGLTLDSLASMPRERIEAPAAGGRFDVKWWLQDAAIDRQIARPLPADPTGVPGFAAMLRRQQSQWQIPLMLAFMFAATGGMFVLLPWIIAWGSESPSPSPFPPLLAPAFLAMFAWQGCVMAIALAAGLWGQRRASLVADFLRPVSRRDYWLALRRAIAVDMILPTLLGGGAMAAAVAWYGDGKALPWGVTAALILGCVALVHAMLLVIATTRRPLVMGTVAGFLFLAAAIVAGIAVGHAMSAVRADHVRTACLAAGAVLALGLGVRVVVLRGLEARQIG